MAFLLSFCGLVSICLSCVMSAPITNDGPKIIDMSYSFVENETIYWPHIKVYHQNVAFRGLLPIGKDPPFFITFSNFEAGEHGGTHMDAPAHFNKTGQTVDQVPLETTIGEAVVIDITAKAEKNPDYVVSVSDLEEWEKAHGRMPDKPIVFLNTGFGKKYWPNKEKYFGSETPMNTSTFHFPGLGPDAATWLVNKRNLKMYGVDVASLDPGIAYANPAVHILLAGRGIPGIENVANLHLLPPRGAEVFAAPMKMQGGSGGPTRLFARIGNKKDVSSGTALASSHSAGLVSALLAAIFTWLFLF